MEIKAYIVDSLVTLSMLGLSNVCHRIDKTDLHLANKKILDSRRDTLDIEFLIGNVLDTSYVDR